MTDNNITLPEGTDQENTKSIIKQQIVQEKLAQEAQTLINSLKSVAKINTFVKY
jgi:hypothetical protein